MRIGIIGEKLSLDIPQGQELRSGFLTVPILTYEPTLDEGSGAAETVIGDVVTIPITTYDAALEPAAAAVSAGPVIIPILTNNPTLNFGDVEVEDSKVTIPITTYEPTLEVSDVPVQGDLVTIPITAYNPTLTAEPAKFVSGVPTTDQQEEQVTIAPTVTADATVFAALYLYGDPEPTDDQVVAGTGGGIVSANSAAATADTPVPITLTGLENGNIYSIKCVSVLGSLKDVVIGSQAETLLDAPVAVIYPFDGDFVLSAEENDSRAYQFELWYGPTPGAGDQAKAKRFFGSLPVVETPPSEEVWYLQVRKLAESGLEGTWSPELNATADDTLAPSVPSGSAAAQSITTSRLTITHAPEGDTAGTLVTVLDGPSGSIVTSVAVPVATPYLDISMPAGDDYVAVLQSYDEVPNYSETSDEVDLPITASTAPTLGAISIDPATVGEVADIDLAISDFGTPFLLANAQVEFSVGDAPSAAYKVGEVDPAYLGEVRATSAAGSLASTIELMDVEGEIWYAKVTFNDDVNQTFVSGPTAIAYSEASTGPVLVMDVNLQLVSSELVATDNQGGVPVSGEEPNVFTAVGVDNEDDTYTYSGITEIFDADIGAGIRRQTSSGRTDDGNVEWDEIEVTSLDGETVFILEDFTGGSAGNTLASGNFGTWAGNTATWQKHGSADRLRLANTSGAMAGCVLSGANAVTGTGEVKFREKIKVSNVNLPSYIGPMVRFDQSSKSGYSFYFDTNIFELDGTVRWCLGHSETGTGDLIEICRIDNQDITDGDLFEFIVETSNVSTGVINIKVYRVPPTS